MPGLVRIGQEDLCILLLYLVKERHIRCFEKKIVIPYFVWRPKGALCWVGLKLINLLSKGWKNKFTMTTLLTINALFWRYMKLVLHEILSLNSKFIDLTLMKTPIFNKGMWQVGSTVGMHWALVFFYFRFLHVSVSARVLWV